MEDLDLLERYMEESRLWVVKRNWTYWHICHGEGRDNKQNVQKV
jgi:hypothetical protein